MPDCTQYVVNPADGGGNGGGGGGNGGGDGEGISRAAVLGLVLAGGYLLSRGGDDE